jgi:hypothetical protein
MSKGQRGPKKQPKQAKQQEKKTPPQEKTRRAVPPAPPPPSAPARHPWWRRAIRVIGSVLGGITLLASLISLWPPLSVSIDEPIDPKDPLSRPFLIRNDWLLPLFQVGGECFVNDLHAEGNVRMKNTIIQSTSGRRWLPAGREFPISCWDEDWAMPSGYLPPIQVARITITIKFSPPWVPIALRRSFGFRTVIELDGDLRWIPD